MTRINIVLPSELSDQHLLAEYRELPRCIKQDIDTSDILQSERYHLGKGHMKWAKKHSLYLLCRYSLILEEMHYRGFKPRHLLTPLIDIYLKGKEDNRYNYYPNKEDILLSRKRLVEKYQANPGHYTWTNSTKPAYYEGDLSWNI